MLKKTAKFLKTEIAPIEPGDVIGVICLVAILWGGLFIGYALQ